MNPLTQIKNTQKATKREVDAGIHDSASWHARFKHSAYVFAGGLDYDLTEGDLLAVFSQYGEIVDMNLIRDKDTGKSKGFAFVAYEDQRSTVVAVDNLNGAAVVGRKIRVEHVDNYKKRKAEAEGTDPNAVDADEEEPDMAAPGEDPRSGQQASRQGEAPGGAGQPRRGRSPPAAAPAQKGALSSEPWAAAGSIFSLMAEARQMEEAKQGSRRASARTMEEPGGSGRGGPGRPGSALREDTGPVPERDRERARGGPAGPSAAPSFGPPRPPPRPPAAGQSDRAPGPGPGSARGDGYDRGQDDDRQMRDAWAARKLAERDGGGPGERRRGGRSASPGGRSPRRYDDDSGRDRRGGQDRGKDFGAGRDAGWDAGRDAGRPRDRFAEGDRGGDRARGRDRSRSQERERQQRGADRGRGRDRER